MRIFLLYIYLTLFSSISVVNADTLNVAVASNFSTTLKQLADIFETHTGHNINIISGSTGKLYSQIIYGAPFDLFLAADEARPNILIKNGMANEKFSRVYAIGKLVFISNLSSTRCKNLITSSSVNKLAIANPKTAPYGIAAKQALENMGAWKSLKNKIVMGENITQTLQFVMTGNADAGFVARSSLLQQETTMHVCEWAVPAKFYKPIKQKMVVLNNSKNKHAAELFWQTMQSKQTAQLITKNGYQTIE